MSDGQQQVILDLLLYFCKDQVSLSFRASEETDKSQSDNENTNNEGAPVPPGGPKRQQLEPNRGPGMTVRRQNNKTGYTATPVACGWAGASVEVT